ncbi:uncharacterized protein LOC142625345 [Castanea sativa]|uniref:uncharacterized protein LOC142625345 n=1 Tax=Castanea sativa TaxID=21020 RepID=UPI003F64BBD4
MTIQDDVLIWPFNPDGAYSVKFGYKFLHEEHLGKQPSLSENEALKPLWKKIWGLNVPNKVKHLAWRACKDSLPTKVNLVRHKITTTGTWNREPKLFATVIWTLWNRRNNLRLGKPALPLEKVLDFAQERPMGINEVEALATRRALEFALELGFDDITLEGDSEILIKNLMNGESKLTHCGNIAADILFLLSHFSKVKLSFIRRHCNRLAHSLTRRAIIPPLMSIWMEEIPPDFASVFLADLDSLP